MRACTCVSARGCASLLLTRYNYLQARWCPACRGPSGGGGLRSGRSWTTAKTTPATAGVPFGSFYKAKLLFFSLVSRMHCSNTFKGSQCVTCQNH